MLKKVVTKFREKVILKTPNNHQQNNIKKVGKREDSDIPGSASPRWFEIYIIKTFCFIKCPNQQNLGDEIGEHDISPFCSSSSLPNLPRHLLVPSPGRSTTVGSPVDSRHAKTWCDSIVFNFFCKNLVQFYCFVCCKNLVRRFYFLNFILQKPGAVLLLLVVGVWQSMLSLNESKHSFYPAGNSCEKLRKTCLESPRPRFLRSSPYYWLWEFRTTRWIWWRRPRWRKRRK